MKFVSWYLGKEYLNTELQYNPEKETNCPNF